MLGERAQLAACRELAVLVTKQMSSIGEYLQINAFTTHNLVFLIVNFLKKM
jgi:hypothetical protein